MITSPSTTKRLLIPRWRSFENTVASGELGTLRRPVPTRAAYSGRRSDFVQRKENWQKHQTEVTAAELVESAIVTGNEEAASDAAQFLASVSADVTPLIRRQSQQLLARLHKDAQNTEIANVSIRDKLRNAPDDAILWVELSLKQIISGAVEHATRSMWTALSLAPNNRFVLRSAARLFSHLHSPDIGYDLLKRSPSTEYDPWLMSAEIAMAGRIERKPAFLKKAIAILEANSKAQLDLSELAGAAATTFLDGMIARRHAKRLFQQSLGVPTANAVAQAEWASQATGEQYIEVDKAQLFKSAKEAQAMHEYGTGNYPASLDAAKQWISEEPFSGRAYSSAAAAANTMDDYTTAIDFCRDGIKHDPKSLSLRNSLAFALACTGQLFEAEQILADIRQAANDPVGELVATANEGLIALRRAEFSKGEALYNKAILGFRRGGRESLATSALAYFAREAVHANHPKAPAIVSEVKRSVAQRRHPVAEKILKDLDKAKKPAS